MGQVMGAERRAVVHIELSRWDKAAVPLRSMISWATSLRGTFLLLSPLPSMYISSSFMSDHFSCKASSLRRPVLRISHDVVKALLESAVCAPGNLPCLLQNDLKLISGVRRPRPALFIFSYQRHWIAAGVDLPLLGLVNRRRQALMCSLRFLCDRGNSVLCHSRYFANRVEMGSLSKFPRSSACLINRRALTRASGYLSRPVVRRIRRPLT